VNIKVLVFGKNGQVAKELSRLEGDFIFLDRTEVDLTDPAACAAVIEHSDAQAVINAAAYTAVDKAEEDIATAHLVNGAAPAAMAQAAAHKGIPFVHISTDYVFEGGGETPWHPSDPTGPLGVYGASKREGEEGVIAAGGVYGILRTSWVFSAHGANFVKTMLHIPTSAYPTPAVRPPNSRLDCATTETVFGVTRPSWKAALAEVLKDLKT